MDKKTNRGNPSRKSEVSNHLGDQTNKFLGNDRLSVKYATSADAKHDDCENIIFEDAGTLNVGKYKLVTVNSNDKVQEERLFEEDNLDSLDRPTITFNHVCTVAEADQLSFATIRNSRSPSPHLEVPSVKAKDNEGIRPPL